MHADDHLMDLYELEQHAKKWHDQKFESKEELLLDAYLYGQYHEAEPYWSEISSRLSDALLGNLTVSAIKRLIGGTVSCRDGDDLRTIITFHELMAKYLKGHLKNPGDFSDALAKFRKLLFQTAEEQGGMWMVDVLRGFSLVEIAIKQRMGVHPSEIMSEYQRVMDKLCPRRDTDN